MNILYIGDNDNASTSYHRASALLRLGHHVDIRNPAYACENQLENFILGKFHYRTGYRFIQKKIMTWLSDIVDDITTPDLIWVNGGELIGAKGVQLLKQLGCPVILYNNDDPTGGRDGRRFDSLLQALPYYDLCAVMREINIEEYKALGAQKVIKVTMSYDEILHQPFEPSQEIPVQFKSQIAFIGTWMRHEKRDEFLLKLIDAGLPVSIWGDRWQKSPHWDRLHVYYRGGALSGRDYVAAVQGAKLCIGMLSKGNRDLHTTRSMEIPYIGGLLCAERTSEHTAMYKEGEEAVFWKDNEECIAVCKKLVSDYELRDNIRIAGKQRVMKNKTGNEDVCAVILNEVKIHALI